MSDHTLDILHEYVFKRLNKILFKDPFMTIALQNCPYVLFPFILNYSNVYHGCNTLIYFTAVTTYIVYLGLHVMSLR